MERIRPHQELEETLGFRITLLRSPSMARDLGLSDDDVVSIASQVADSVTRYNASHPDEMLPKTTQEILSQMHTENSIILARQSESGWEYLHHNTIYELLDQNQSKRLGWQVLEFGTAITREEYRGKHIGGKGLQMLRDYVDQTYGDKYVGISTIKQYLTGNALRHAGARAVRWDTHPYISYLTDSCEGLTPTETGHACMYRRPAEESSEGGLHAATHARGGSMPCTLVAFQPERAEIFEVIARQLHKKIGGNVSPETLDDRMSPEYWQHMRSFFESLK